MLKLSQIPALEQVPVTGYRPQGTINGEPMPVLPVHDFMAKGVALYPVGIREDIVMDADWPDGTKFNQEML